MHAGVAEKARPPSLTGLRRSVSLYHPPLVWILRNCSVFRQDSSFWVKAACRVCVRSLSLPCFPLWLTLTHRLCPSLPPSLPRSLSLSLSVLLSLSLSVSLSLSLSLGPSLSVSVCLSVLSEPCRRWPPT